MSTERYYTIDIVPTIARDLLIARYFSPTTWFEFSNILPG